MFGDNFLYVNWKYELLAQNMKQNGTECNIPDILKECKGTNSNRMEWNETELIALICVLKRNQTEWMGIDQLRISFVPSCSDSEPRNVAAIKPFKRIKYE